MDGIKMTQLEAAGIDVKEALGRFMDNEALMLRFLLRFPSDENFSRLKQAMQARDAAQAFEAAHTLKGVTGNLSMKEFYGQVSGLVEHLRGGDMDAAALDMPALERTYDRLLAALGSLG